MEKIWLIGTGLIGIEYAKVLNALNIEYLAIGRGKINATEFEKQTKCKVITGGLESFLLTKPIIPSKAIVAVGVEALAETTKQLLEYGLKNILLEKPGVAKYSDIYDLVAFSELKKANVLLAYNRRFYSSVFKAEEIINEDGGVVSFNFEFTEWSHVIEKLEKPKIVFNNWILANSTHVIDTAFFLGGDPIKLSAYHKGELEWHPSGSVYSGAGISKSGALFSYQANWNSPGRWVVEILTLKHRLYLKPMESLQIQKLGSVALDFVPLENHLDIEFKPGFYLQTKAFIDGDYSRFCSIEKQEKMIENAYLPISGY